MDSKLLEKLRKFDTPTICNAIELFDVRPRSSGYMDGRIQCRFPELPQIVGFAATATFRSAAPPRQGDVYSSMSEQIQRFAELDGPAIVVFQDLDDPGAGATFGEQMCLTYKAFGAAGLITSGAGRDLEQVRAFKFPVFTNGAICAHGYCHTPQVHVPVRVGGIVVYPNDLLHADMNGVTTIPKEIVSELPDATEEFLAAEAVLAEAMQGEQVSMDILRDAGRQKSEMIKTLHARVSRKK